jgi:hypothetical protein
MTTISNFMSTVRAFGVSVAFVMGFFLDAGEGVARTPRAAAETGGTLAEWQQRRPGGMAGNTAAVAMVLSDVTVIDRHTSASRTSGSFPAMKPRTGKRAKTPICIPRYNLISLKPGAGPAG